jgi:hypothetical protein
MSAQAPPVLRALWPSRWYLVCVTARDVSAFPGFPINTFTLKEAKMEQKEVRLQVEELEQRIAPDTIGNPGNNNPPLNNTNNPGNEGTGGNVSTGN